MPESNDVQNEGRDFSGRQAAAESKYRGVKGWLLLFCVSLVVLSPAVTIYAIASAYGVVSWDFDFYRGLLVVFVIDTVVSLGLMAFSIYAGIALWKIRPGAVRLAAILLRLFFLYSIVGVFLAFVAGGPSGTRQAMGEAAMMGFFRTAISVGIWYQYLKKSKRVKATFGTQLGKL